MKFKEGEKVQFIKRGVMITGVVKEVKDYDGNELWYLIDDTYKDCWVFEENLIPLTPLQIIPKFVANYLDDNSNTTLYDVMNPENTDWCEHYSELRRWIQLNSEECARAWLDGYEIEQEQLYYVKLPILRLEASERGLEEDYNYLGIELESRENNIFNGETLPATLINSGWKTKLTEKEIKAIDERYWAFAVPVEKVEGE
ncbi:DUF1642 domain-containing protein [Listeria ivanovii subsp. londoniensis]|uniref:DUF1642 domain-containing protein n=1 Tax=Listeria ivanovii TaxID=1638 RepID=UPI0019034265|nr:DUF1642 domain-containing protein [Listeria ivanovii]MBK2004046.1 DUF1642 domain-containing protein [Listeria ivanovii subsp. londoniensis]